jgi:ABC-2 type transport system ATP-binding protein
MSLQVEHINKWFGPFQAIKDLSMEVKEGALFGFLGTNGAGKTTTMRMILDLFLLARYSIFCSFSIEKEE